MRIDTKGPALALAVMLCTVLSGCQRQETPAPKSGTLPSVQLERPGKLIIPGIAGGGNTVHPEGREVLRLYPAPAVKGILVEA